MAKALPPKASGTSRIRFIMVDAEISDSGDLTQVTQAIQNALRPPTSANRLPGPVPVRVNGSASVAQTTHELVEAEEEPIERDAETEETEAPRAPAASNGPKPPRKLRVPKILDLDLTSEPSFAQFVTEKDPTSHLMRYLTVAAWFKLHRKLDAITADHVYTCYRAVKWPTDIQDFAQPLRDLKARQLMHSAGRGEYAINHIGLQEVENLGKS